MAKSRQRRTVSETALGAPTTNSIGDTETEVLRVEVFYSLGGMNYFSYKTEPRGYYLSVQRLHVGSSPLGFHIERFNLGRSGIKAFLEAAHAFSAKKLAALVPPADLVEKLTAEVLASRAAEMAAKGAS